MGTQDGRAFLAAVTAAKRLLAAGPDSEVAERMFRRAVQRAAEESGVDPSDIAAGAMREAQARSTRRNDYSKKKPECGACAQSWNNRTGFFTPCNRDQAKLDAERAEESGITEAQRRADQAARDLRRRALARGIDAPDDVPDEARENPRRTRRNADADLRALERRVLSGDLAAVTALARAYERADRGVVPSRYRLAPCVDLLSDWGMLDTTAVYEAIREGLLRIDDLWDECGQGNTKVAIRLLEDADWYFSGDNAVDDVFVMSVPDDLHGEAYRIYARYTIRRPSRPQGRDDLNAPSDLDDEDENEN